jgi:hypothetical protein
MATCYNCGGYKPDGGFCPACRKIESDKRIAAEQREANENLARQQLRAQEELAALMAADSQKKHDELMLQEEIRLKELKKQTQILLEQGLTVDEVYQNGFNFEELNESDDFDYLPYVQLKMDERGNIIAVYENPYVQDKFRKAYQKGIDEKLNKNYSKGPGIEFMAEAAFNHGYLRSEYCPVSYPNKKNVRFFYAAPRQPEVSESINQQDGSIECNWVEPYDSDILNQSFEAGVEKYLKEQNTAEKKNIRLAQLQQEHAQQRAIEVANDEAKVVRAKQQAVKDSQEKIARCIKGAIGGGLFGALAGAPIFFFIWFFSILFGGTSWTLVGLVESLAAIGAVVGFFRGFEDRGSK